LTNILAGFPKFAGNSLPDAVITVRYQSRFSPERVDNLFKNAEKCRRCYEIVTNRAGCCICTGECVIFTLNYLLYALEFCQQPNRCDPGIPA